MDRDLYENLLRIQIMYRNNFLAKCDDFGYDVGSIKQGETRRKVGTEINFHLGEKPLKIDNGLVLDPRIVAIVKALARRAAEEDFEAQTEK